MKAQYRGMGRYSPFPVDDAPRPRAIVKPTIQGMLGEGIGSGSHYPVHVDEQAFRCSEPMPGSAIRDPGPDATPDTPLTRSCRPPPPPG